MSEWPLRKIEEVADFLNHRRIPVKASDRAKRQGKYPYYGASGIVDYVDSYLFDGNFLLISEDGENLRSRNTPIAFMGRGKFWVNNHAHILDEKEPGILRYLEVVLNRTDLSPYITGAAQPKLNKRTLSQIEIPVPPLKERLEINTILGALDDKIELNRKTATTLEEMARALYRSWFVDFDPVRARAEGRAPAHMDPATAALFPDSFGEDGLPVGWSSKPFPDLVEILSGGTPKTSEPSYWGGEIPWYSVVDAPPAGQVFVHSTEKSITAAGLNSSPARIVPRGTTILSARGTVGKLALAPCDMTFNQSCYGLRGRHRPLDAFTYFSTLWVVDQLRSMAHGSVFATITRQTFEGLQLPSATPEIMHAFEIEAAAFLKRIDLLGKENRTLATLRDTLLPRLMSGELRTGVACEIVEEVA